MCSVGAKKIFLKIFNFSLGIPCLHLPKIGKALLPSRTKQYRYPEIIKITCETGYVVESSDKLQCNSSGFWNYIPQYTCIGNIRN